MDSLDFTRNVISGCEAYLSYLNRMQEKGIFKGMSVLDVFSIRPGRTPSEFVLEISKKVKEADSCQIFIDHQPCGSIKILKSITREAPPRLLIDVSSEFLPQFREISPRRLHIVSDMRFLIERLSSFYQAHAVNFSPTASTELPALSSALTAPMSQEQYDAYIGVCGSPVSYVWGPPGTGKTKMVLSRCILRYVLAGKRVFLLAPTNNAIEQVLRGVLPVMREAGIDLKKAYRLGTSSAEFASEYPQVVGDKNLEALLAETQDELNTIQKEIDAQRQSAQALEESRLDNRLCQTEGALFLSNITCYFDAEHHMLEVKSDFERISRSMSALSSRIQLSKLEYASAVNSLNCYQEQIELITAKLRKRLYYILHKSQRLHLEEELQQYILHLSSSKSDIKDIKIELESFESKAHSSEKLLSTAEKNYASAQKAFQLICSNLSPDKFRTVGLRLLARQFREAPSPDFSGSVMALMQKSEDEFNALLSSMKKYPEPALLSRHAELTKMLEDLSETSTLKQKREALILAGTIESSLDDLPPAPDKIPVSHVFIDEAGYTSLARGMVAFSCNCPVSFFGDHMQLPPICEMSKIPSECAPVSLFSIGVAYYSNLLHGSMYDLYTCSSTETEPLHTPEMPFFPLNLTYRFGDSLARLLAKHFYSDKFHGLPNSEFQIIVLDVPAVRGEKPRVNLAEVQAIKNYLQNQTESDFIILAPYRDQVFMLNKEPLCHNHVLTVHRSQGREWDTIILSVSDTNNLWYTNSSTPVGRRVLNTAISRARKRLVIACDANFWSHQEGQFIQSLLDSATPLNHT